MRPPKGFDKRLPIERSTQTRAKVQGLIGKRCGIAQFKVFAERRCQGATRTTVSRARFSDFLVGWSVYPSDRKNPCRHLAVCFINCISYSSRVETWHKLAPTSLGQGFLIVLADLFCISVVIVAACLFTYWGRDLGAIPNICNSHHLLAWNRQASIKDDDNDLSNWDDHYEWHTMRRIFSRRRGKNALIMALWRP